MQSAHPSGTVVDDVDAYLEGYLSHDEVVGIWQTCRVEK